MTVPRRVKSVQEIIGHKFNHLTVERLLRWKTFPSGPCVAILECRCDCGSLTEVTKPNLVSGHTQSCINCGHERSKEARTTHGQARKGAETPLYRIWAGMLQRCSDPNSVSWEHYGKRGIKVLWNSFEEFARDMEATYQKGLTIERDDFNGHYEKKNCRWIPRPEQNRNYRRNRFIEFRGEKLPMIVWAERFGVSYGMLQMRLKHGWSFEDALTKPSSAIADRITFRGETMLLSDWARKLGIDVRTLWARLKISGWSVEKTLSTPVRHQ